MRLKGKFYQSIVRLCCMVWSVRHLVINRAEDECNRDENALMDE